jgi:miniconductance mechanosensitive channel
MIKYITDLLLKYRVAEGWVGYLSSVILVAVVVLLSIFGYLFTKKVVLKIISHYILNNKFNWDDIILKRKVFHKLSHIVPATIIYLFASAFSGYQVYIERAASAYIIFISMFAIDAFLDAVNDIYNTYEVSKLKPIKGYLQVIKIAVYIIGGIVLIANLIGKNPLILLSGIGALTAVFSLIFKDSILGLVAGIQLTSNDMVRIGDWIEMPKYGADGDVMEITLNTVKVRNFDKTITTIPTYTLISDSFRNWRGMQVSGGRRIMRNIYIDTASIKICTDDMINRYKNIKLIMEYIENKQQEINKYNAKFKVDSTEPVNGRRLTNIGTFRAYIEKYLENHPGIHKEMIHMVRQLQPAEYGLPLQIYAFTSTINWIDYEKIQADIFDHLLAIASEFELRIFQNTTGYDMRIGLSSREDS